MTVRRVEIRLTSTGFDDLSKKLDQIDLKLDRLKAKFDELSKKVITPKINVDGITRADAELDKFSLKLDEIGRKRVTAHVGVNVDSGTARRDTTKLLEDVGKGGGLLGRLFGGGGGGSLATDLNTAASGGSAGGSTAGGLLSAVGGANNSYFGALIASLVGAAALVTPAILPFAIGGGVGLGAGGGAFALGNAEHQKLVQLAQQLSTAKGAQAKAIQKQMTAIQSKYGPELGVFGSVSNLGTAALGSFNSALTTPGRSFVNSPLASANSDIGHFVQTPSFIQGLDSILKQVGGFMKSIGPALGDMFRASLPFIGAFAKIMEQLAKALMPAFTQTMKELQPYIPQIIQGFKYLSMGIATFIKNLGPGMKDAAIIFKAIMAGIGDTLGFLGTLFAGLAIEVVKIAEGIEKSWDWLRHRLAALWDAAWHYIISDTISFSKRISTDLENWRHDIANKFDDIRHDAAAIWDHFWSDVASAAVKGWHEDISQLDGWRHDIASVFDNIRHDIASVWDLIWNNTIGRLERGVQDVDRLFGGWRNDIKGLLQRIGQDFLNWVNDVEGFVKHLPGALWKLGKEALTELWNGMKSVSHGLLGWFGNFVGNNSFGLIGIAHKLLHMSPPRPGSAFYDLGREMMQHLEAGVKSHVNAVQGAIGGNIKAVGGSVAGWISQAMRLAHAPSSWLPALERLVSLESGGNPRAIDPIAIAGGQHATGLWQMLPSTFASYSRGGSIFNPVAEGVAAIDYIKANYGSPFSIPGLMSGHYSGYLSGGWVREPVYGIGMRSGKTYGFAEDGRSEYVSPHGAAGGVTIIINAHPSNNPNEIYNEVWQGLRNLKRNRGNQALGLA